MSPLSKKNRGYVLGRGLMIGCAAVGLLNAQSGHAQDAPAQTQAGAQAFLAIQFNRGMRGTSSKISKDGFYEPASVWRVTGALKTDDICVSNFQFIRDSVTSKGGIIWKSVLSVRQDENTAEVKLILGNAPHLYRFEIGVPDLAARVTYAMDFLRRSCDPAAATGF